MNRPGGFEDEDDQRALARHERSMAWRQLAALVVVAIVVVVRQLWLV